MTDIAKVEISGAIPSSLCGLVLIGLPGWLFYSTPVGKNLPADIKRRNWFVLLFIAGIIYIIWQKLTAA